VGSGKSRFQILFDSRGGIRVRGRAVRRRCKKARRQGYEYTAEATQDHPNSLIYLHPPLYRVRGRHRHSCSDSTTFNQTVASGR
jgi:hypothetical protein